MKYNTIYAFGENNESGIRSRQVPVWRGLISVVLSLIDSGPNNYYGIDMIPVCTGSGISVVILALNPRKSGQIANKGFLIYYGRYRSQLAILRSPKQNSCSNWLN